jgi:branched-chain amino acid transport system substrate-binding protein
MTSRRFTGWKSWLGAAAAVLLLSGAPAAQAQDDPTITIGIVTFLSGGAAGPFGVPARNAAELVVEAINNGDVPAPYDTPGIAGAQIRTVIIDEAGGTTAQVAELRNLVEREGVDLVVGYISSGDCLAVAPVAEELQALTVLFDCGTPRIFEEAEYRYVFRTGPTATLDNVALARYLLDRDPDISTIAGINQNYAWGQDSWLDFKEAMVALKPDIEVTTEQFPQIYAGQYGGEISALLVNPPDVVHSSFWGADLEAFILQGVARGLFDDSLVALSAGEPAMFRLAGQIPEGTVIGARGPHGVLAPDNELNAWFRPAYMDRFATPPIYASYKMTMALLGVKTAYEKAAGDGDGLPDKEAVIDAFEHLEFETPSGLVRMALGNGHQAIMSGPIGVFGMEDGEPALVDVVEYPAECVNPPEGVNSLDWIRSGFEGAEC